MHFGLNHPEYALAAAKVQEVRNLLEATGRSIARRVEIEYRQALDRERMLAEELQKTKAEFDSLNARSFEYQALKREADRKRPSTRASRATRPASPTPPGPAKSRCCQKRA